MIPDVVTKKGPSIVSSVAIYVAQLQYTLSLTPALTLTYNS